MRRLKTYINRKFTYWYIKKGYIFSYTSETLEPHWECPWWVRPLLIFFSPSIYFMRKYGELFCESFRKGLREATKSLDEATKALNKFAEEVKKGEKEHE